MEEESRMKFVEKTPEEEVEIEVLETAEGYILRLELSWWRGYYCEKYVIQFLGNELTVIRRVRESVFTAFKTTDVCVLRTDFEEIPWWIEPEKLRESIEEEGVKRTAEEILEYIRDVFVASLEKHWKH